MSNAGVEKEQVQNQKSEESLSITPVEHEPVEKKETQEASQDNVEEETASLAPKDNGKMIIITTVIILVALAGLIGGFKFYNNITGDAIITLDDMHFKNIDGELDEEEGFVYNGFSFVKFDGLWWTDVIVRNSVVRMPLHFSPREAGEVEFSGELDKEFNFGENVYIAIDPLVQDKFYTLALSELSFSMAKGINRAPIGSCTMEHPACVDREIVSCENTQGKPVVELSLEPGPSVEMSGTCIKVTGQGYDIVKAVDRLLYGWYKVME